jgi:hypothetical protein
MHKSILFAAILVPFGAPVDAMSRQCAISAVPVAAAAIDVGPRPRLVPNVTAAKETLP